MLSPPSMPVGVKERDVRVIKSHCLSSGKLYAANFIKTVSTFFSSFFPSM
jgi:hypothetical protein